MKDSKLIQTLKTFTKEEIKNFEKFLASPFFNKGRNYLPLLNTLKKHYPEFENVNFTSENVYRILYPGKKFNKQVMWNQVSELEKLAMEFLVHSAIKKNKQEKFVLMFDELSGRNLDKQIIKEIEKANKHINSVKLGKNYFSFKWIVENSKAEYWNLLQGRQDKSLEGTVNSAEYLILNFLADLSVLAWDLHVMKIMYNTGDEINLAFELVRSLNLKKLVNISGINRNKYALVINFYFNKIMCALNEDDESYFFEMKKFFEHNYDLFDIQEQRNTIISIANYCALKMRTGNEKFLRILFELNKFRLEKEIEANKNGRINKALYHQILRNALSLGEIEWSEDFVRKFTSKLKREHQKTMNALARGYIYYAKSDYATSLEYLNKVEFIDLRDKLHVRILSAKAYYELNNTESLFYYIDSCKHFIGNNKDIEGDTKEAYLKFFNFLNKLMICKENPNPVKIKKLKENIHFATSLRLRHKTWLFEKLDEL